MGQMKTVADRAIANNAAVPMIIVRQQFTYSISRKYL